MPRHPTNTIMQTWDRVINIQKHASLAERRYIVILHQAVEVIVSSSFAYWILTQC